MRGIAPLVFGAGCLIAAGAVATSWPTNAGDAAGWNPHPVKLMRPAVKTRSAMAQLGKLIFFDPSL